MAQNPEIQLRAQMEIDEVIGRDRLPNTEDLKDLPFVQAVISEVLRWHPVAPIGLPHRATKDVHYNGYIIPKDATLIANLWYAVIHLLKLKPSKAGMLIELNGKGNHS